MRLLTLTPIFVALLTISVRAQDPLARILEGVYAPPTGAASDTRARVAAPAPATHLITENELLARVEAELTKHWHPEGELRLALGRPWQPMRVPSDDWQVSLPEMPIGGLSKSFLLRLRIVSADRTWLDQQVVVQAQLWRPVLVSSRRLDRGQALDRSAAQLQTLDVLRERVSPVPAETDLGECEVLQGVAEGRPLSWKDIGRMPMVKKGAVVAVVANEGGMTINMKGVAMGTGSEGDAVTVRNMDSRKDFQARVVSKNTVRVTF